MRVRILSPFAEDAPLLLSSYLVDDVLAIDAGCLGLLRDPPGVRHVFLTHAHADHVLSLPMFLQSVEPGGPDRVTVYGSGEVIDSLREDIFNGRFWPEYPLRPDGDGVVRLEELQPETPVRIGGILVTPVPVDHVVPTNGFLVDDGRSVVAFGADSGPTSRLWELARTTERCRAVFLESTFPDELSGLAERTGHLTPDLVRAELPKLPQAAAIVAVHLSARHQDRIGEQLRTLGHPQLSVGRPGHDYHF